MSNPEGMTKQLHLLLDIMLQDLKQTKKHRTSDLTLILALWRIRFSK